MDTEHEENGSPRTNKAIVMIMNLHLFVTIKETDPIMKKQQPDMPTTGTEESKKEGTLTEERYAKQYLEKPNLRGEKT